jgi:hypothetical protein
MAVVLAVGVPALALGGRAEPAPAATTAPPRACPVEPGPAAPGLPAQSRVRGSLAGDPAAVTAVLRTGWHRLRQATGQGTPLRPATARVVAVHRAADGTIVGVVGATGSSPWSGRAVVVTGPALDRLSVEPLDEGLGSTWTPLPRIEGIAVAAACGRPKVIVLADGHSTVTRQETVGVDPDGTVRRRTTPVPFRSDGLAVLDRPTAPTATISLWTPGPNGSGGGRSRLVGPVGPVPDCVPAGSGCTPFDRAVAAAPGDADPAAAAALLRRPGSLPLPSSGLRVLWRGTTPRGTVTAAVTTLPGGAEYVWGGMAEPGREPFTFGGPLPAGGLAQTALVLTSPQQAGVVGTTVVFVPGTATIRLTADGARREFTGTDAIVVRGTSVTDISARRPNGIPLAVVRTFELPSVLFPMPGAR